MISLISVSITPGNTAIAIQQFWFLIHSCLSSLPKEKVRGSKRSGYLSGRRQLGDLRHAIRPLPHTLYAIYLVTLFITSTGTDNQFLLHGDKGGVVIKDKNIYNKRCYYVILGSSCRCPNPPPIYSFYPLLFSIYLISMANNIIFLLSI